jgi:hypothetical protein
VAGRAWAHVAAYAVFVGEHDPALDVHHLCDRRDCIEPTHLRQLTHAENCRLRTQRPTCRNGHPREVDEATGRYRRTCRACNRENQRRRRERQAEVVHRARGGHPGI